MTAAVRRKERRETIVGREGSVARETASSLSPEYREEGAEDAEDR
jgi:hypothetical protein